MKTWAVAALVAMLAAEAFAQGQAPSDRAQPSPGAAPTNDARPAPSADGNSTSGPSHPPAAGGTNPGADASKPAAGAAGSSGTAKPQKESGWYSGGIYSFNLLNIEYYDLETKDLHFSGQRRDIDNDWAGLAELLTKSKGMGFVEIDRKFVNLRNLSAIHDLGGGRGATLTFRDGATLKITGSELHRLIEVTR